MTNIYILVCIGIIGLVTITLWEEKKKSKRLQNILYNILEQDKLAITLHTLLVKYEETAGLSYAYNIFYSGVLQAISDSKTLHMISMATIIKFEKAEHISQAKYLCMEMIEQLRWDSLNKE